MRSGSGFVIRVSTIKSLLWFVGVLLIALGFPLQVYTGSPLPSLFPYVIIALIAALHWLAPPAPVSEGPVGPPRGSIARMVGVYVFAVLTVTAFQVAVGLIDPNAAVSALVIYALPVVVYAYFRRAASQQEIAAVLRAIVVAGVVVAVFFVYDSYVKLGLGRITDYSRAAYDYSLARSDSPADANPVRLLPYYRSFGLLEKHAVSAAWIVFGAFAALALISPRPRLSRRLVVLLAGAAILVALNFTMILAFAFIAITLEFGGAKLLRGRVSAKTAANIAALAIVTVAIAYAVPMLVGSDLTAAILASLRIQSGAAIGTADASFSAPAIFMDNVRAYLQHIAQAPFTLVFGDGYATYGALKGGDAGVVETLERFGLPLFVAVATALLSLIASGLRRLTTVPSEARALGRFGITEFSVAVLMLIVIADGHYSIWYAKAVLPIGFFALALFERVRGPATVQVA